MSFVYNKETYNTSSAEVVVPIINNLFKPKSILDVGCGLGTWLRVFQELYGLEDFIGLDGSYINKDQLMIEPQYFKEADLIKPFDLKRKFDLLLCLEVAEHLPESAADRFVESVCIHSDNIVFSAAIPGQGGQNHLNERWPDYWQRKFRKFGFKRFDLIRPKIWTNDKVDIWYRQNIFLYSKSTLLHDEGIDKILAEVHPELWLDKIINYRKSIEEAAEFDKGGAGIVRSFKGLFNAIVNKCFRW